jgi:hypothetical protein
MVRMLVFNRARGKHECGSEATYDAREFERMSGPHFQVRVTIQLEKFHARAQQRS